MRYATAQRSRDIDRLARERYYLPSIVLMENAGIAVAEEIIRWREKRGLIRGKAVVFCGKGNNGGDGFVTARHLRTRGHEVTVFVVSKLGQIKKIDPLLNLKPLVRMGVKVSELADDASVKRLRRSFACDFIIDAIFGIGFSGRLSRHVRNIVDLINGAGVPVFAVDIPSGLDATKGRVYEACVKADITVTFGLPKTGFIRGDGPRFVGDVIVRDIYYPTALLQI